MCTEREMRSCAARVFALQALRRDKAKLGYSETASSQFPHRCFIGMTEDLQFGARLELVCMQRVKYRGKSQRTPLRARTRPRRVRDARVAARRTTRAFRYIASSHLRSRGRGRGVDFARRDEEHQHQSH